MDAYEATKTVFSRIQNLDPDNASKIMGLLLIQDHGEKEMIRLAFGPENLLHSLVVKARQELGISVSPSTLPPSPSPFLSNTNTDSATAATSPSSTVNNGCRNPFSISRQNSTSTTTSRFLPNGLKIPSSLTIPSLNSPSSVPSPSWGASVFSDFRNPDELLISPNNSSLPSPSFFSTPAASNNGISSSSNLGLPVSNSAANSNNTTTTIAASSMKPTTPPFYPSGASTRDLIDEIQLQEQLSFMNDTTGNSPSLGPKNPDLYFPQPDLSSSPGTSTDSLLFPYDSGYGGGSAMNGLPHRRSFSVSEINLGPVSGSVFDDPTSGFGWKPCLYYARGYCKNGSSCRFVHSGLGEHDGAAAAAAADAVTLVGSPSKFEMLEQCHELLRSKSMQQQKLMAAMASANPFPYSGNKSLNFVLQQQQNESQRAAAALMIGEDMQKFGRSRLDRSELLMNGRPDSNPGSRQIYLTFPADSTFREEDVSNYFSIYGPVQDVRIPYQQKRMFGFVTFLYPETVKMILAKGNPHFVCDARVLVKPYKEKGKVPDKYRKQQQLAERGEFSASNSSPISLDSRDPFDLQFGARMMYNNAQEMLWRRKLEEQADLQQALDFQNRRLMDLQLIDVKGNHHHRTLSTGGALPSPIRSPNSFFNHSLLGSDRSSPEAPEENSNGVAAAPNDQKLQQQQQQLGAHETEKEKHVSVNEDNNGNDSGKDSPREDNRLPGSFEHNLPDSPFASPTRGAGECKMTTLSGAVGEPENAAANGNVMASSLLPATSLDMAPFKSCYFQMPSFFPGHGAIGM